MRERLFEEIANREINYVLDTDGISTNGTMPNVFITRDEGLGSFNDVMYIDWDRAVIAETEEYWEVKINLTILKIFKDAC